MPIIASFSEPIPATLEFVLEVDNRVILPINTHIRVLITSTDENLSFENSVWAKVFSFKEIFSGVIRLLKCHPP